MKKLFSTIIFVIVFCLTPIANADNCTKSMLSQISDINGSWKPIIGNSLQIIKKNKQTIIILKLYDNNKIDADPQFWNIQALFLSSKNNCSLLALVMAPINVESYLDMLME